MWTSLLDVSMWELACLLFANSLMCLDVSSWSLTIVKDPFLLIIIIIIIEWLCLAKTDSWWWLGGLIFMSGFAKCFTNNICLTCGKQLVCCLQTQLRLDVILWLYIDHCQGPFPSHHHNDYVWPEVIPDWMFWYSHVRLCQIFKIYICLPCWKYLVCMMFANSFMRLEVISWLYILTIAKDPFLLIVIIIKIMIFGQRW